MMFKFVSSRGLVTYINIYMVQKITVTSVGLESVNVIFVYHTGAVEAHILTMEEFKRLDEMITPVELKEISWNTTLSGEKNDGG